MRSLFKTQYFADLPSVSAMETNPYSALYIFYYVFAAFSFLCSSYVTACILQMNSIKSSSTRVILYLHVTLLIEDVASLPFIFTGNHGMCKFMAFVKYYSGLANICVIGLMIVLYRAFLFDIQNWKVAISRWAEVIIFIFPLITLLPFSTNSYVGYDKTWCVMNEDDFWSIIVFYAWAWLLIIHAVLGISRTIYEVFKIDRELAGKLFTSIGLYTCVSVICWIPRSINRAQRLFGHKTIVGYYGDTIVLFLSGFLYFLIFLTEKNGVIKFENAEDSHFRFSISSSASSMQGGGEGGGSDRSNNRLSMMSNASTGGEMLERISTQSNITLSSAINNPINMNSNAVAVRPSIHLDSQNSSVPDAEL